MVKLNLGNIYPPLEQNSFFVQLTKGCSWNKCLFCDSYSEIEFNVRSVSDIETDLYKVKMLQNTKNNFLRDTYDYSIAKRFRYSKNVFFQDNDILELNSCYLKDVLALIKRQTGLFNFSAYSSISNMKNADLELLSLLGLKRLYIGLETGNKNVLKLINKKHKIEDVISAHKEAKKFGVKCYYHYIVGIGGEKYSKQHAIDTANLLNEINPHAIEIRTTVMTKGLRKIEKTGKWKQTLSLDAELKLFLSELEFDGYLFSDHECNSYRYMNGKFSFYKNKWNSKIMI